MWTKEISWFIPMRTRFTDLTVNSFMNCLRACRHLSMVSSSGSTTSVVPASKDDNWAAIISLLKLQLQGLPELLASQENMEVLSERNIWHSLSVWSCCCCSSSCSAVLEDLLCAASHTADLISASGADVCRKHQKSSAGVGPGLVLGMDTRLWEMHQSLQT